MAAQYLQALHTLIQTRRGSPAIEFALLAPVMSGLLVGTYDVTQLLIIQRRVITTAQQIVEIATELSVQPDQTMALTTVEAYQAQTAVFALMPALRMNNNGTQFFVALSAVVFTETPSGCAANGNCSYIANTAWSVVLSQSTAPMTRPCGVITQVTPDQPVTINNLPTANMTSLNSILVADVSYVYRPVFTVFINVPMTVRHTAMLPPRKDAPSRYVQYDVAHAANNPAICPGYL